MENKKIIVVEVPDGAKESSEDWFLSNVSNDYEPYQSHYHTQVYDDVLDDDKDDDVAFCWLNIDEGEAEVSEQFYTKIQELVYNIVSNRCMNYVPLDKSIDVLTDDWGEQTGILEEAALMGTQDFHLRGITEPIANNRIRIGAEANATVKGYVVGEIYGCSDEWEGNPEFVYPIGLFVRMDVYVTVQLSEDGQDIVEYFDVKTLGSATRFNLAKPEDDDDEQMSEPKYDDDEQMPEQTFAQKFGNNWYFGHSTVDVIEVDIDDIDDSRK